MPEWHKMSEDFYVFADEFGEVLGRVTRVRDLWAAKRGTARLGLYLSDPQAKYAVVRSLEESPYRSGE